MKIDFFSRLLRNAENEGGAPPAADPAPPAPPAAGDGAPPAETVITPITADPPSAGGAAKPEEPPAPPAPLTVEDIKLPDGVTASPEQLTELTALFNDEALAPADRVAKLVEMHAKLVADSEAKIAADWNARQAEASKALLNHPEMGGAKLAASQAAWSQLLNEFGSPALRAELDTTGMGNSVEFGQFLLKIAAVTSEGKPLVGAPTSDNEAVSVADRLYPNQGKL